MTFLSPWAFGARHPLWLLALYIGLAVVLLLWACLLILGGSPRGGVCPASLCLAGMILLGVFQLVPLPLGAPRALAPPTALLREQLLPPQQEAVAGDEGAAQAGLPSAATISFFPAGTREQILKLLAVLALFAAVRYNLAGTVHLHRLALVAVVNGALLSLFALVQWFTCPPGVVYWHFVSHKSVFGPFINRNHFPFYVNICLGLGLGLLLGMMEGGRRGGRGWRDAAAPWLGLALVLMLAANLTSVSRGGVMALLGAVAFCAVLKLSVSRRFTGLAGVALVLGLGLGLVGWLGTSRLEQRLDTVWSGEAIKEARGPLWARVLPLAGQFPLWGTGYGTFEFVEPLRRRPGDSNFYTWDRATTSIWKR